MPSDRCLFLSQSIGKGKQMTNGFEKVHTEGAARIRAEKAKAAYRAEPTHANRQAYERAIVIWNRVRSANSR